MSSLGRVVVPNGTSGDWKVDEYTVTKHQAAMSSLRGGLYWTAEGKYKRLVCGSKCVMSNTRMERITNSDFVDRATGRVLINGLGLGMVLTAILAKPEVTYVRVIEKHEDVIRLVGPSFASESRVEIVHADALEYRPAKGERFDVVWHDIWNDICEDNNEDMKKLHRRYGRICGWQGSWARGLWR